MQSERITTLEKFLCQPFRQEVELQQVEYPAGYTTLRLRIREGKRFTVFDIDAATAAHWGDALAAWARRQGERK